MTDEPMPRALTPANRANFARLSYAYWRLDGVVWRMASAWGELNVPPEIWREIRAAREIHHIAHPEPVFVLRGQDVLAPQAVRQWAELAAKAGVPGEKIERALDIANKMEEWPHRKVPD